MGRALACGFPSRTAIRKVWIMAGQKWIQTSHKGLRYYEHATRRHGVRRDRYYAIRFQFAGKRIEEGVGWSSEGMSIEKALKTLLELKENAKRGQGPVRLSEKRKQSEEQRAAEAEAADKASKENITFAEFWEIYAPQAKADKKLETYLREEGLFRIWVNPEIGHLKMKDITVFDLEKLKKTMGDKGQSPRSILYALGLVRHIMNYAKPRGYFQGDVPLLEKERKPKLDNARMRYFKPDEIDVLLQALRQKSIDVYGQALLAAHGGLRFGEITALVWADVQWDEKRLTIRGSKNGSRSVFMTDEALDMLKARIPGEPWDLIFQKRGGGRINQISYTFGRTMKELGFNRGIDDRKLKVCFHSLRHSYGTLMYDQTHDLYVVQRALGHKTTVMSMRYAKMTDERLQEATEALGKALKNGKHNMYPPCRKQLNKGNTDEQNAGLSALSVVEKQDF